MVDVRVRQAVPTDVPAICGLVATATAKLWGQPSPSPDSEGRMEVAWHRRVVGDEFEVFVAEFDHEVVGETALTETWDIPTSAHLSSIAVRFDLWGRGIARHLLQHGVAHLRQRGYKVVECWTEADNPRSIRLYEGDGWTRLEDRRWHHETGRWLLHFERQL